MTLNYVDSRNIYWKGFLIEFNYIFNLVQWQMAWNHDIFSNVEYFFIWRLKLFKKNV